MLPKRVEEVQDMEETTTRGQVSRRTIAKGMAWAAPAIPVVAMAPKAAASPAVCIVVTFVGDGCKGPGQPNDFLYQLEVCNVCPDPFTLVSIGKNNGGGLGEIPADETGGVVRGDVWEAPADAVVGGGTPEDPTCYRSIPLLYSTNSGNFLDVTITQGGTTTTYKIAASPGC